MKFAFVMMLSLCSLTALADDEKMDKMSFEEGKAKMTEHLNARSAKLDTAKACVAAAADKEALKACRKSMKEEGEAMKKEWKQHKMEKKKSS